MNHCKKNKRNGYILISFIQFYHDSPSVLILVSKYSCPSILVTIANKIYNIEIQDYKTPIPFGAVLLGIARYPNRFSFVFIRHFVFISSYDYELRFNSMQHVCCPLLLNLLNYIWREVILILII